MSIVFSSRQGSLLVSLQAVYIAHSLIICDSAIAWLCIDSLHSISFFCEGWAVCGGVLFICGRCVCNSFQC